MHKSLLLWRFEPAKFAEVFDSSGFEGEDDFGKIEPFDFGKFLLQAMAVFFA